jgi:hypothetical protein
VEVEVKGLLEGALAAALAVTSSNRALHAEMSERLAADERLEGAPLARALTGVQVRAPAPSALAPRWRVIYCTSPRAKLDAICRARAHLESGALLGDPTRYLRYSSRPCVKDVESMADLQRPPLHHYPGRAAPPQVPDELLRFVLYGELPVLDIPQHQAQASPSPRSRVTSGAPPVAALPGAALELQLAAGAQDQQLLTQQLRWRSLGEPEAGVLAKGGGADPAAAS